MEEVSDARKAPSHADSLVRRIATGDHRAFDALYDQLGSLVYGIVLRVVCDPTQAEEVTQEVFIEIWQHAGRFDGDKASARGWASIIAHRRGVDRVRSEQAARDLNERNARQPVLEQRTSAADAVSQRYERGQAAAALVALSETQREVIELAYYQGLTQSEIADRLRIPLGTVKTRARDGLSRMRRELGRKR